MIRDGAAGYTPIPAASSTLNAVDDTLCLAKGILVREEFLQLEAEMKQFVDRTLLAVH